VPSVFIHCIGGYERRQSAEIGQKRGYGEPDGPDCQLDITVNAEQRAGKSCLPVVGPGACEEATGAEAEHENGKK
jgi:hypothetical protein